VSPVTTNSLVDPDTTQFSATLKEEERAKAARRVLEICAGSCFTLASCPEPEGFRAKKVDTGRADLELTHKPSNDAGTAPCSRSCQPIDRAIARLLLRAGPLNSD
jgi:hypothetical protein